MKILIGLTLVIISLCKCIPNHHVVHLKYMQLLFLYNKNIFKIEKNYRYPSKKRILLECLKYIQLLIVYNKNILKIKKSIGIPPIKNTAWVLKFAVERRSRGVY